MLVQVVNSLFRITRSNLTHHRRHMMIDDGILATCPKAKHVLAAQPCRLFDNLFEGIVKTVSLLEPPHCPRYFNLTTTISHPLCVCHTLCRPAARLRLAVVTLVKVVKRQWGSRRDTTLRIIGDPTRHSFYRSPLINLV